MPWITGSEPASTGMTERAPALDDVSASPLNGRHMSSSSLRKIHIEPDGSGEHRVAQSAESWDEASTPDHTRPGTAETNVSTPRSVSKKILHHLNSRYDQSSIKELYGDLVEGERRTLEERVKNRAILWSELTYVSSLAEGSFGKVDRYLYKGKPVAVKTLHLSQDDGIMKGSREQLGPGGNPQSNTVQMNKKFQDEDLQMFCDEVIVMASVEHPNLVQFIGCSISATQQSVSERPGGAVERAAPLVVNEALAVVTELCEMGSLAKRIRQKEWDPAERLRWALDVAKGMAHLHGMPSAPIIHRDLKPDNVLITRGGVAKVSDFGLSVLNPKMKRIDLLGKTFRSNSDADLALAPLRSRSASTGASLLGQGGRFGGSAEIISKRPSLSATLDEATPPGVVTRLSGGWSPGMGSPTARAAAHVKSYASGMRRFSTFNAHARNRSAGNVSELETPPFFGEDRTPETGPFSADAKPRRPSIFRVGSSQNNLQGRLGVADVPDIMNHTAVAGTYRYMAPEVYEGHEYGTKVDVFSFAILLWEVFANETTDKAFPGLHAIEIARAMAQEGARPPIPRHWPEGISSLVRQCWEGDPSKRPEFAEIVKRLSCVTDPKP